MEDLHGQILVILWSRTHFSRSLPKMNRIFWGLYSGLVWRQMNSDREAISKRNNSVSWHNCTLGTAKLQPPVDSYFAPSRDTCQGLEQQQWYKHPSYHIRLPSANEQNSYLLWGDVKDLKCQLTVLQKKKKLLCSHVSKEIPLEYVLKFKGTKKTPSVNSWALCVAAPKS